MSEQDLYRAECGLNDAIMEIDHAWLHDPVSRCNRLADARRLIERAAAKVHKERLRLEKLYKTGKVEL